MEKAREFQKNIYFCFIDYAKAFDYVDHDKLWKILKEIGIQDHLICLLRNLIVYFTHMQSTSHKMTDESQIGIKIAGRNINNFRYADTTTIMAKSIEEINSLLMRMKKESKRAGVKLNIKKTKIMVSSPITSWHIDGKKVETVTGFILGYKITVDGDCSHEIERCLLLGRTAMTNLDIVLKTKDITLLTKICIVKAMFFPVFMYGCESWTIKKAEC